MTSRRPLGGSSPLQPQRSPPPSTRHPVHRRLYPPPGLSCPSQPGRRPNRPPEGAPGTGLARLRAPAGADKGTVRGPFARPRPPASEASKLEEQKRRSRGEEKLRKLLPLGPPHFGQRTRILRFALRLRLSLPAYCRRYALSRTPPAPPERSARVPNPLVGDLSPAVEAPAQPVSPTPTRRRASRSRQRIPRACTSPPGYPRRYRRPWAGGGAGAPAEPRVAFEAPSVMRCPQTAAQPSPSSGRNGSLCADEIPARPFPRDAAENPPAALPEPSPRAPRSECPPRVRSRPWFQLSRQCVPTP
jgi:hypothetical protein